ncbi:MAG: M24 family metallopeptidase, partial [Planctomycetota bacterium]
NGDCTRTVVHGAISDQIQRMHHAVVAAKKAAVGTLRTGVMGSTVHQATVDTLKDHGFAFGFPGKDHPNDAVTMPHGTGHGLGLAVHEPPLLDDKGTALVHGDVVTIEPGLYGTLVGGIRVEDVYAIQGDGATQLGGTLHEGLSWPA